VTEAGEWVIDLDEALELPGWFLVPDEVGVQQGWAAELEASLADLVGAEKWDGEATTVDDIRDVLAVGIEVRNASTSDLVYQVWPIAGPVAVYCHVNVFASASLPSWSALGAVRYSVDSPHLGTGVQLSTRQTIQEGETALEYVSVHVVFDNGEVALVMSLDEAMAPLVSRALPGFVALMRAVQLQRSDGAPFVAVPPADLLEDAPWKMEDVR